MDLSTRTEPAARRAALLERCDARVIVVVGALLLGVSALLVKASDTPGPNATFFRCLFALPVLVGVLAFSRQRVGAESDRGALVSSRMRRAWLYVGAGVFLAADMILWAESIRTLGAGVSTVIVNVQLVVVPVLCRVMFKEMINRWFWLAGPAMLLGIALAGRVWSGHAPVQGQIVYGTVTGLAAGLFYGAYLVILRKLGAPKSRVSLLLVVTAISAAAAWATAMQSGTLDFALTWRSFAALAALAITGQVIGWLCVASGLSRLSSTLGPSLLLLQPVSALTLGVWAAHETPTSTQVGGCVLVIAAGATVIWVQGSRAQQQASVINTGLRSRSCSGSNIFKH